jgi:hypothetical protein
MGLSLISSAVNEVQFPMANGSVSSRLNLRNNRFNPRSLQIEGGKVCNLYHALRDGTVPQFLKCNRFRLHTCSAPNSEFSEVSGIQSPMEAIVTHFCQGQVLKKFGHV